MQLVTKGNQNALTCLQLDSQNCSASAYTDRAYVISCSGCSQLCSTFCTVTAVYCQLNVKDPQKLYKHHPSSQWRMQRNLTETPVLFFFNAAFTSHKTAKPRSFRCLSSSHKSEMMQNSYVECSLNSEIRRLVENQ